MANASTDNSHILLTFYAAGMNNMLTVIAGHVKCGVVQEHQYQSLKIDWAEA